MMSSIKGFGQYLSRIDQRGLVRLAYSSSRHMSGEGATSTIEVNRADSAQVKPFHEIPAPWGVMKHFPMIGSMFNFKPFTDVPFGDFQGACDRLNKLYGPIVRANLKWNVVLVFNPDDFLNVFRHEGKYPYRPEMDLLEIHSKRTGGGLGLTNLQGKDWLSLRTPLNKRLAKVDSASHYIPAQNQVAIDFVNILLSHALSPEQTADYFFRYSAEAIGVVCFNKRVGFLDPVKMKAPETVAFLESSKNFFKCIAESVNGDSFAHTFYRNRTYRNFEDTWNITRSLSNKYVDDIGRQIEESKKNGTFDTNELNLLNSLLCDSTVERGEIKEMISSLFNGGTDSTAKCLTVLVYLLGTHQDKQDKLRHEVTSLAAPDGSFAADALSKMTYLRACLKESFRMHNPLATGIARKLAEDVVLSGYQVPKGTMVMTGNPTACKQIKNADKFIPERWLRTESGQAMENIHKMLSLPFGYGPRTCVGKRFAEQEILLAAAHLVLRGKIHVAEQSKHPIFHYRNFFVDPQKPIEFVFKKMP